MARLNGMVGLPEIDFDQQAAVLQQGLVEAETGDFVTRDERVNDFLSMGIPGVLAGFVDTVGTSLGILEDNDMEAFLKSTIPVFGDFYARDKAPLQTTADLTGLFVPGMIAIKALRGAGVLARMVNGGRKNALLDSVFTRSGRFERSLQAVKNRDKHIARTGGADAKLDAKRKALALRAQSTRISDIVKENFAFEAGVFATMNDSQTLYPDEFTTGELIALNAAFPAIFAVASFINTNRLFRASIADAKNIAAEALNPAGVPQPISRGATSTQDGSRDTSVTVLALSRDTIAEVISETIEKEATTTIGGKSVSFGQTKTNLTKEMNVIDGEIILDIKKLGNDKPFPWNAKTELSQSHINTAKNALDSDPATLLGAESIDVLTLSRKEQLEILKKRTELIDRTRRARDEGLIELAALRQAGDFDDTKVLELVQQKQQELKKLNLSELYVLEPDGSLLPLRDRKSVARDSQLSIKIVRGTKLEPKRFEVVAPSDSVFGTPELLIGITEDFQMILSRLPEAETRISGINVTKILSKAEVSAPENFKEILRDIGADWHLFGEGGRLAAKRGADVFKTLPRDIQRALESWRNAPDQSPIRGWFEIGDPRAAQLMKAFEPMRQRLREVADADGTIPLLRGENRQETLNPTIDVVSMTSDPKIAIRFAGGPSFADPDKINVSNVISRRVNPDDVIVVIGGLGKEFEYIVKGNLNRVAIPTEVRSSFEALTLKHRSAAYAGLQKAIKNWTPETGIILTADDHYTRFDAVIELHKKFGDSVLDKVKLPQGLNSIDDLHFASLGKKYDDFVRIQTMQEAPHEGTLIIPEEKLLNYQDMVKMFNLPGTSNNDLPPLFQVFITLHSAQGEKNLRQAVGTLDNLKRMIQEVDTLPELLPFNRNSTALIGNQLSFPEDSLPLLLTKRSVSDAQYGRENLIEAVITERIRVFNLLARASEKGGDLVQSIMETLISQPQMLKVAKGIETLSEGQQRGTQAASQFSFAIGENPALNAQHTIRLVTDKAHKKNIEAIFSKHIPTFNKLKAPNSESRAGLVNFNLYVHARRQGWDILEETVPISGIAIDVKSALKGFKLEATERNQARFQKMFGRAMEKDELMPAPGTGFDGAFLRYQSLAMTPLALQGAFAFNELSTIMLANKNVLRTAMGRGEMWRRPMHVPPRSFTGEELVFLLDDGGEVVSVVSGRNLSEVNAKADAEIVAREGSLRKVRPDDVERYFDIRDKAFNDFMDLTDPLLQTGPITGKQVGNIVDVGQTSLNDSIKSYQRQFESILRQTRGVVFEPEVAFARKRFTSVAPKLAEKKLSIWQQYISAVYDNPTLDPKQLIGMSNLTVERYYDAMLSARADLSAAVFNPPGLKAAVASKREDKVYRDLEKSLGDHNPFQSGVDFANKTFNVKPPASMRKDMSRLTSLTSFLTLRMMEVGHFVLTMTSLAATMPAVVSFMRKTKLEQRSEIGHEEWVARTSLYGIPVDAENAMFSPVRAMSTATHEWFTDKEFRAAMGRAGDQGYFDQFVSEAFKAMTAPAEGYVEGLVRRSMDIVSILSDKGERWARAWSFGVGYSIAKRSGLQGDAVLFTAANDFANKVIGDFSTTNRPRIFQGASGMPLGLFMTFMWNYHQRLFSYIENGANRALATQVATQAAVFGGQTIPGFQQFSDTFLSNYDGSANPIDGMNNRFGTDVTEVIMMGAVSNVGKLFGFDDSPDFSGRGDVNPRNFPTLLTVGDTPVVQMGQDFFNILRETFGMLRSRGEFDDDQMANIIQSYSTNRFLRNMATLYNGFVTDRRGQVIVGSPSFKDIFKGEVQNEIALISRFMGVRTLRERARVAAHARVRSTELSQRYRLGELRDVLRSDARSGKLTKESLENAFAEYIRWKGSPDYFPRFVMEQFLRGTVDKTSLDLMKMINNPQKMDNVLRLMNVL